MVVEPLTLRHRWPRYEDHHYEDILDYIEGIWVARDAWRHSLSVNNNTSLKLNLLISVCCFYYFLVKL